MVFIEKRALFISAKAGADGKIDVSTIKAAIQQDNQAVSSMASLSLMTWRQENNDMNKRLGEVRASEGSQGIWARMARGQSKYGQHGIKNQHQSTLSWEASHERVLS